MEILLSYVTPKEHLGLPNKEDVRDYAARLGVDEQEALKVGMKSKSVEFREKGAEVYLKN